MSIRRGFFFDTLFWVLTGMALWVIVLIISNAHPFPLDITENHRFTLAEQSVQAVNNLKEPVKVYAFVDEGNSHQHKLAEDLLTRYRRVSSKFDFELIDPMRRPSLAKKFGVKVPGPAVVEIQSPDSKDKDDKEKTTRSERCNAIAEDDITNALLKLSRHTEITVHVLTGHGERPLDSKEPEGLGTFKADLVKEGITLEELNLAKSPKLPPDCKILMIAGPTTELLPGEQAAVEDFLKNQGHLLMLLEPDSPHGYAKLLEPYGITSPPEVIIDEASQLIGAEPIYALGLHFDPDHPITKGFRVNVVFRVARPVFPSTPVPSGVQATKLAETEKYAYTVPATQFIGKSRLELPPNPDHRALGLAVASSLKKAAPTPAPSPGAEQKQPETRVVCVGDADFVSNQLFRQSGNRDFSLNIVNWLAETENQITIRPRDAATEPLRLTQSDIHWVMLWHMLMIPGAVAVMGFFTVMLRRR